MFERDNHQYVMCPLPAVDAHHIVDRADGGTSTLDNGISLCSDCHEKAEMFHRTGISHTGYSPNELKERIDHA